MTEKDLQSEWAWSQIEAYADGSLSGANRKRMEEALEHDARLWDAVERASEVYRALRAAPRAPLPAGLRARLLGIPGERSVDWRWIAAPAGAFAAAVLAAVIVMRPPAPPPADPQVVAAVQQFELAMRYVQKSATLTGQEVTGAVGSGLRDALLVGRGTLDPESRKSGG